MTLKKIVLPFLIALLLMAGTALAQDEATTADTETWQWAEAGLIFDYPAAWRFQNVQGFDFILIDPVTQTDYIGLQTGTLAEGETLQAALEPFAEQFGTTMEETTLGGVDALRMAMPANDSGAQAVFYGFEPAEGVVALLNITSTPDNWEAFQPTLESIVESIEISYLDLDTDLLNQQLQASFAANQTLTLGNPEADVRLVEVLDFSCPHCVNYASSMERVIADYALTDEASVELVFVTFVGGEASDVATQAMYCAVEAGYGWDMHDLINAGFQTQSTRFYNVDSIVGAVEEAGWEVDTTALRECIEAAPYDEIIATGLARADEYGVTGTPSVLFAAGDATPSFIVMNGQPSRGGIPLVLVYGQLDQLLAETAE